MGARLVRPAPPPPPTRSPADIAATDFRRHFDQYLKDVNANNILSNQLLAAKNKLNTDYSELSAATDKLSADQDWINSIIADLKAQDVVNQVELDKATALSKQYIEQKQALITQENALKAQEQQLKNDIAGLNKIISNLDKTYKMLMSAKNGIENKTAESSSKIAQTLNALHNENIDLTNANQTSYGAIAAQNNNLDNMRTEMKETYSVDGQKVLYQNNQTNTLVDANGYLIIVYYILLVLFVIILWYNKNITIFTKIICVLFLSIYPYVIYFIQTNAYVLCQKIYAILNRDVYSKTFY
jgi:predicted  nucleic acid-binding Zn-ribbon protein